MLTLHFGASGLVGFQSQSIEEGTLIQNVSASVATTQGLEIQQQTDEHRSIFSNGTILTLLIAVVGLVSFRRNSFL
jgi:hypothetical protein